MPKVIFKLLKNLVKLNSLHNTTKREHMLTTQNKNGLSLFRVKT